MRSLLGISVWIALVTAIPGLVTIATLYGAFATSPGGDAMLPGNATSEWLMVALAVTVMVLTQALGILLEEALVRMRWLGGSISLPVPRDVANDANATLSPYDAYSRVYYVLARLEKDRDAHGHLQRAVSQFFLTNNTLVSFLVGLIAALIVGSSSWYVGGLLLGLAVSYLVVIIRFREMAKSIWSVTDRHPALDVAMPSPAIDGTATAQPPGSTKGR